jgi:23S rRNA-intervening sequence protein
MPNSKLQLDSTYRFTDDGDKKLLRFNEDQPREDAEKHGFDLEERTAQFGEAIVRFAKKIPQDPVNNRLIAQSVGCGTSIGANYCEASERVSRKDFRNIIGRCVKEAKEARFFSE